jgi:hypothetical protein
MRLAIAALLLLAAPALAGRAWAAPAPVPAGTIVPAPDWAVGSEWYYSDGYALKVTSASDGVTVFDRIDAPGQWFSRKGFIRKDSTSATATRNAIYRTIPDKDGFALSAAKPLTFQREYLSNGKLMVHATSWTVEGRETITVPAGTFDCWRIVWRTRSLKSDWTGFERWWYSPQAQNYVRMEYKYGPGAEGSRVLMRYHVGPVSVPEAAAQPASAPMLAVKTSAIPPAKPAPHPQAVEAEPASTPLAASAAAAKGAPSLEPDKKPAPPPASAAPGDWHAQVGSSKNASAMSASLEKTLANNPQLAGLPNGITPHQVAGRGTFYRAWIGAVGTSADAKSLCGSITGKLPGCAVFKAHIALARD